MLTRCLSLHGIHNHHRTIHDSSTFNTVAMPTTIQETDRNVLEDFTCTCSHCMVVKWETILGRITKCSADKGTSLLTSLACQLEDHLLKKLRSFSVANCNHQPVKERGKSRRYIGLKSGRPQVAINNKQSMNRHLPSTRTIIQYVFLFDD